MKFCPECGFKLSGTKFCPECGANLTKFMKENKETLNINEFDGLLNSSSKDEDNHKNGNNQQDKLLSLFETEKNSDGTLSIVKLKDKTSLNIQVPTGVTSIGEEAFMGSQAITISLPEGLLLIGDRAFKDCKNLVNINLPSSLLMVGEEAFLDCKEFDQELPTSVKRIGNNALKNTKIGLEKEEQSAIEKKKIEENKTLGKKYFDGKDGYEKNHSKALEYYLISAELGDLESQYIVGYIYDRGYKVKEDYKKAFYWYEKAAKRGHVRAQYNLAVMYRFGNGIDRNYQEAFYWFEHAAEQGDMILQKDVAEMYERVEPVNMDRVIHWYEISARRGSAVAAARLGDIYLYGQNVPKDEEKGLYWHEIAAKGGFWPSKEKVSRIKNSKN